MRSKHKEFFPKLAGKKLNLKINKQSVKSRFDNLQSEERCQFISAINNKKL